MRFRVPQFIETEEKVVGPFTLKQFLWIGGAGALLLIIFQAGLNNFLSFFIAAIIIGVAGLMAFFKVDGEPLPVYLSRMLTFAAGTKRYYFRKKQDYSYTEDVDRNLKE